MEQLRKEVNVLRREIKRDNRRRGTRNEREKTDYEIKVMRYRLTKGLYEREIGRAKAKGWKELVETLDQDPCGRPYKIVRRRIKGNREGPVMERTDPIIIKQVVDKLFPKEEREEEDRKVTGKKGEKGERRELKKRRKKADSYKNEEREEEKERRDKRGTEEERGSMEEITRENNRCC